MSSKIKHVVIEGVDRLGKDSLIQGIQDNLGYFLNVHYQKPSILQKYKKERVNQSNLTVDQRWSLILRDYQEQSFINMFRLLSGDCRVILNRAHLGEYVYSPLYRKYDGSYVFDLEDMFIDTGSKFREQSLLVLLTTSDFSFIEDDGLSLDFSKKEAEQELFKKAFSRSKFTNKLMIDVSNSKGSYRPHQEILESVLQAMI